MHKMSEGLNRDNQKHGPVRPVVHRNDSFHRAFDYMSLSRRLVAVDTGILDFGT